MGSGPSQYIPQGYIYFSKIFYDTLIKLGKDRFMKLYEYDRDGWSFHSKGLWVSDKNTGLPSVSMIGSTNFSYR